MLKKCAVIVTFVLLTLFLCCRVNAESWISYDGTNFEFSSEDPFEDFKLVMPGDEVVQEIIIKNYWNKSINLFIRPHISDEESKFLLSQLTLRTLNNPDINLLEENDWINLGEFFPGDNKLSLVLSVPSNLGNAYAGKVGYFEWGCNPEDAHKAGPSDEIVAIPIKKTGDTANLKLWIILIIVSLMVMSYIVEVGIRRKRKNNV